jgi:hypothetical protein
VRGRRPVDVVDGVEREVEEDDVLYGGDVNASRSDVSTDEILSRGVVTEELQIGSPVVRAEVPVIGERGGCAQL